LEPTVATRGLVRQGQEKTFQLSHAVLIRDLPFADVAKPVVREPGGRRPKAGV